MKSRWSDEEAPAGATTSTLLVYVSRLLGADPSLVLAGGGNSSVKTAEADVFGEPVDVLHVKGSGWDMAIDRAGGVRPAAARPGGAPGRAGRRCPTAAWPTSCEAASLDGRAPAPSVESILHAIAAATGSCSTPTPTRSWR